MRQFSRKVDASFDVRKNIIKAPLISLSAASQKNSQKLRKNALAALYPIEICDILDLQEVSHFSNNQRRKKADVWIMRTH